MYLALALLIFVQYGFYSLKPPDFMLFVRLRAHIKHIRGLFYSNIAENPLVSIVG